MALKRHAAMLERKIAQLIIFNEIWNGARRLINLLTVLLEFISNLQVLFFRTKNFLHFGFEKRIICWARKTIVWFSTEIMVTGTYKKRNDKRIKNYQHLALGFFSSFFGLFAFLYSSSFEVFLSSPSIHCTRLSQVSVSGPCFGLLFLYAMIFLINKNFGNANVWLCSLPNGIDVWKNER